MQFERIQRITGYNFRWEGVPLGDCCWKKEDLYTFFWEKLEENYTGEIHVFAEICKAKYTAPLGLLPDYVVFYKLDIIVI